MTYCFYCIVPRGGSHTIFGAGVQYVKVIGAGSDRCAKDKGETDAPLLL